jgi:hypothetical protein
MLELGSDSLILVSAFGLLNGLAMVLAGPLVGNFIDRLSLYPPRVTAQCIVLRLNLMGVLLKEPG